MEVSEATALDASFTCETGGGVGAVEKTVREKDKVSGVDSLPRYLLQLAFLQQFSTLSELMKSIDWITFILRQTWLYYFMLSQPRLKVQHFLEFILLG